jgi:hypothetical protein
MLVLTRAGARALPGASAEGGAIDATHDRRRPLCLHGHVTCADNRRAVSRSPHTVARASAPSLRPCMHLGSIDVAPVQPEPAAGSADIQTWPLPCTTRAPVAHSAEQSRQGACALRLPRSFTALLVNGVNSCQRNVGSAPMP